MTKKPAGLEVFKAGTHVASDGKPYTFSAADVQELVASYDPAIHEAPLVVGHPKLDDPAYGWAKSLKLEGASAYAEPYQVEPQFADLVNTGALKKISASIYLRDTPGNPTPGKLYLKHIGFLGAQAPAVKGLRPAQFAEDSPALEFAMPWNGIGSTLRDLFQRMRDSFIARDGVEAADQVIPQWAINNLADLDACDDNAISNPAFSEADINPENPMRQNNDNAADFAEQQQKLDTKATELDQREKALKKRESDARRDDVVAFAEGLAKVGKITPPEKAGIVEVLLAFPAGTVVSFAEAEGQDATDHAPAEVLRKFLAGLPARVDFAEKSGDHNNGTAAPADFAAPSGVQVDAGRMEVHSKALAYQRAHPNTAYMTAVKAVSSS